MKSAPPPVGSGSAPPPTSFEWAPPPVVAPVDETETAPVFDVAALTTAPPGEQVAPGVRDDDGPLSTCRAPQRAPFEGDRRIAWALSFNPQVLPQPTAAEETAARADLLALWNSSSTETTTESAGGSSSTAHSIALR
jgi:hypothetical protein